MNKDLIIRKIAFITEEMQQQTQEWLNKGNQVSSLEIDAFLSNIRYLIEQSEILNDLLIEEKEDQSQDTSVQTTPAFHSETSLIAPLNSEKEAAQETVMNETPDEPKIMPERIESIEISRTETLVSEQNIKPINEQLKSEQESLLERLKKNIEEGTLADRLKANTLKKDLNFSLNDRFFMINQLFNGDTGHFSEVIYKVSEYNDWSSVEKFLEEEIATQFQWIEREDAKRKFYDMLRDRFSE